MIGYHTSSLLSREKAAKTQSFGRRQPGETDFELTSLGEQLERAVDVGTVHGTGEVVLNGIDWGSDWKGSRILPCSKALQLGTNHLKREKTAGLKDG